MENMVKLALERMEKIESLIDACDNMNSSYARELVLGWHSLREFVERYS
jgi:hypothetical protein